MRKARAEIKRGAHMGGSIRSCSWKGLFLTLDGYIDILLYTLLWMAETGEHYQRKGECTVYYMPITPQ